MVLRLAHGPQLLRKPLSIHECHVWALTKAGHAREQVATFSIYLFLAIAVLSELHGRSDLLAKSAISIAAQSHVVYAGMVIERHGPPDGVMSCILGYELLIKPCSYLHVGNGLSVAPPRQH